MNRGAPDFTISEMRIALHTISEAWSPMSQFRFLGPGPAATATAGKTQVRRISTPNASALLLAGSLSVLSSLLGFARRPHPHEVVEFRSDADCAGVTSCSLPRRRMGTN